MRKMVIQKSENLILKVKIRVKLELYEHDPYKPRPYNTKPENDMHVSN